MKEKDLHRQICNYLKWKYPDILFNVDLSGVNVGAKKGKELKQLRSNKGFPDIHIMEARGKYHGLFLEIKKESPYKQDGKLKKNKHIYEQAEVMNKLIRRGYSVKFAWEYEMATEIIDKYLK